MEKSVFGFGTQRPAWGGKALYSIVGSRGLDTVDAVCGAIDTIGADWDLCRCHCFGFPVGQAVGGAVGERYC